MKRFLALALALVCLLTLASCDKAVTPETKSANKIVYGEKYFFTGNLGSEEEESYYIFVDDQYLQYTNRDLWHGAISHYTVTYRYEIMDEGTLAYFFDSVEIYDDDTESSDDNWGDERGILLFSENVLSNTAQNLYVRESFLKEELKNFGKKPD